uniref:Uncharacterized protein n=1 Tax=Anopheles dirus TaxID=7168 RepID=A0A182NYF1_9DIPT
MKVETLFHTLYLSKTFFAGFSAEGTGISKAVLEEEGTGSTAEFRFKAVIKNNRCNARIQTVLEIPTLSSCRLREFRLLAWCFRSRNA